MIEKFTRLRSARLRFTRLVAVLVVLPLTATGAMLVASTAPAQAVSARTASLTAKVIKLTNKERAKRGLPALRANSRLMTAAQRHSWDMATRGYFSHTSPGGSSFVDRARYQGYRYALAENIAYGYKWPYDVVKAWMKSAGHRKNILNRNAKVIGVGVSYNKKGRPYWTQEFGYR